MFLSVKVFLGGINNSYIPGQRANVKQLETTSKLVYRQLIEVVFKREIKKIHLIPKTHT